jgi:acyl carrier protein
MDIEQELRAIVKTKLPPGTDFDMNMKLADAGLDSLDVVELAFDIEDKFHIQLPPMAGQITDVSFLDLFGLIEEKLAVKAAQTP